MGYEKRPKETHRVVLSTSVSRKTKQAILDSREPGDGYGQVIDRWAEMFGKKGNKE